MAVQGALNAAITRALNECDVLVTSGGVSMGSRDLIKPLLEKIGELFIALLSAAVEAIAGLALHLHSGHDSVAGLCSHLSRHICMCMCRHGAFRSD